MEYTHLDGDCEAGAISHSLSWIEPFDVGVNDRPEVPCQDPYTIMARSGVRTPIDRCSALLEIPTAAHSWGFEDATATLTITNEADEPDCEECTHQIGVTFHGP
jgi:hypothetical protein